MKTLLIFTITIYFLSSHLICQNNNYWKEAPTKGTKLYNLAIYNSGQGIAHSKSGEILETNDGGKNWFLIEANDELLISGQPLWSAEIYCSVMATIDGGTTWTPYLQEQQEHFCLVYFKDNNTGWNIAGDFLNKVVSDINEHLNNDDIESLLDNPHQCTEYFTNIDSGWALGWCIGNFKDHKGISME